MISKRDGFPDLAPGLYWYRVLDFSGHTIPWQIIAVLNKGGKQEVRTISQRPILILGEGLEGLEVQLEPIKKPSDRVPF